MNRKKQLIVDDLKALGYNSKMVSVKQAQGGYDSCYTITIRDPSVNYPAVEEIERKHEYIDRDESSGEILCGGNVYIRVTLNDEVADTWANKFLPAIQAAIKLLKDDIHGQKIDQRFSIFNDGHMGYKVWDNTATWVGAGYYLLKALAIDLYILTLPEKMTITKEEVFNYWAFQMDLDSQIWLDSAGELDITSMGENAAIHFECISEDGHTAIEKNIFDWAVDFDNIRLEKLS